MIVINDKNELQVGNYITSEPIRVQVPSNLSEPIIVKVSGSPSVALEASIQKIIQEVIKLIRINGTYADENGVFTIDFCSQEDIDNALSVAMSKVTELGDTVETQATKLTLATDKLESKAEKTVVDAMGQIVASNKSAISQTPEQIRLAVESLQIGGTNLLRDSSKGITSSRYLIGDFYFGTRKPKDLEPVTIRVWGKLGAGRTGFVLYNTNSYVSIGTLTDNNDGTYSGTFEWKLTSSSAPAYNLTDETQTHIRICAAPNDASTTSVSVIDKVKLEIGHKATEWSPAPEDTSGALVEAFSALDIQAGLIEANTKAIRDVNDTASGAVSRVTSAEQSISALTGEIKSKVSSTDFNALGERVANAESSITQTPSMIRSEVSSEINKIQIGGTNLLSREGVTVTNGSYKEREVSAQCRSGREVVYNAFTGNNIAVMQPLDFTAGTYTVSFVAWSEGTDAETITLHFNLFNEAASYDQIKFSAVVTEEKTYFTGTFSMGANAYVYPRFFMGATSEYTKGTVHLTDWKVESGNKSTAWSINPEDTEDAINTVKEAVLEITSDYIISTVTESTTYKKDLEDKADADYVATNYSTIKQTADSINLAVQDVQVGGANVLRASDVTVNNGGACIDVPKASHCRSGKAIKFNPLGTNSTNIAQLSAVNLRKGKHTVSFNAWGEETDDIGEIIVRFNLYDGDNGYDEIKFSATLGEKYQRFEGTFELGGNLFAYPRFLIGTASAFSKGNVYITDWKLEAGTKATDWTAAQDDIDEAIKNLSSELSIQAGEIKARVTEEQFNALGQRVGSAESAITQTASDIMLEVNKKANSGDPAGSVKSGSSILITEDRIKLAAKETLIEIPSADGEAMVTKFDENGVTADRVTADNLAYRYNGPAAVYVNPNATSAQLESGGYYRSLADACSAIGGRYLDKGVTVTVQGATYGDVKLRGIMGSGGVTIEGGGNSLYGSILMQDNTAEVWVNKLKVVRSGTDNLFAARQFGTGWVSWNECVFDANGGDHGLQLDRGTNAMIWKCEIYNALHLLRVSHNSSASCIALKGGGGTNFMHGDGGMVTWNGTRPDGAFSVANPCLREPYDLASLPIDYGTAQPSAPVVRTAAYDYLYSDSYREGWNWIADDDVRQGYNGGRIYGVIWFDAAAIRSATNGKTINQASLRLYMHKGVGRGVAVSIQLYGTNKDYAGRTGAPELTKSYGTIGTATPGEVNEIAIPVQAAMDIVNGTTKALVLYSDDTGPYKDRGYSANYAWFAGTTSADSTNGPRLTVTYQ